MAAELLAVGVTLDFAPVLDVLTNAKNPAIGDRALSERVEDVATLGRTLIEALQGAGLAAAGKHFPGHGDTSVDSHLDLPICELPPDRLRARRARAVPRGGRRRRGLHADLPRALHRDRRRVPGDAVAAHRAGDAQGRARLSRRGDHRRPRHEGDRQPLHDRGDGGALPARRLRRLPDLQRRLRQEGARARSGHPRGRGRHGVRQARRGRHDADAPAEGAVPGRPPAGASIRSGSRRWRRSSTSWSPRRCGSGCEPAVRPAATAHARRRCGPAIGSPSWRRPARARRRPSAAVRSSSRARASRSRWTIACGRRPAAISRAMPRCGPRTSRRRSRIPPSPASSAPAAATAAPRSCRCSTPPPSPPRPRCSSATATSPRCTPGCSSDAAS